MGKPRKPKPPKEPKPPTRQENRNLQQRVDITSWNVAELFKFCIDQNIDMNASTFHVQFGVYDDYDIELDYVYHESEADFQKRYNEYLVKYQEYKKKYKEYEKKYEDYKRRLKIWEGKDS